MALVRVLRFGGTVLLGLVMVAPGNASECINIGEWNDLVSAVTTATGTLTLCKFDIDKPALSKRLLLDKRLSISCYGATETQKCTVRGPGHHFQIAGSAAEVFLDGFAFHGASECAVRVISSAKKTQVLQNCNFINNKGIVDTWRGGAIKTERETSLVVSACNFIGNKAGGGGAIFHRGNYLSIHESVFRDNVAKVSRTVYSLILGAPSAHIKCRLSYRTTDGAQEGGAIMGDTLAFFEVHDSYFVNNTAARLAGGAIRVKNVLTMTGISNVVGSDNAPCNGVYDMTSDSCEEFPTATVEEDPDHFVPGELTIKAEGLRLSTGLTITLLAKAGELVELSSPEAHARQSGIHFHTEPDGAAVFGLDDGGWVYLSNSEIPSNGGVYGLEFDAQGRPRSYSRRLSNTNRNCAGGVTPWNTWVSCEEYANGQCWQVDPTGQRNPEKTELVEPTGGNFESMAVDDRDPNQMKFFVTEDHPRGALRRFTPRSVPPSWEMLHMNGTIEYLEFLPGGSFQWTPSKDIGRQSAFNFFPNVEGISHHEGIISFVSKVRKQIFHLRLDLGTYTVESTIHQNIFGGGSFDAEPDQLLVFSDVLYFTEDGGSTPGIYAHDGTRMYALVEALDTKFVTDETTGFDWSPDRTKLYFCFQQIGYLFQLERKDGLPFDGNRRLLSLRYHRGGGN